MAAYPDEGTTLGPVDFGVRTVAEDNYWDRTGLTASGPCPMYGDSDEPEPPGMGMDMDDMRRRPTWMPVEG